MTELRIALQTGAMKDAMTELFAEAFMPILQEYEASFDGIIKLSRSIIRVRFMKSSSIPEAVVSGEFHGGITGQDVIFGVGMEKEIQEIVKLPLARRTNRSARVVLAGMAGAEFEGAVTVYADREYSRIAHEYIKGSPVVLELQDGAAEEKVRSPSDFAVIATETGSSLAANGLVVVKVLMESSMTLFVSRELFTLDEDAFTKVEDLGRLLQGVLIGRENVLMKMNVLDDGNLEAVSKILPSLASPSQTPLRDGGHALEVVVFANEVAELTSELYRAGATAIFTQRFQTVIP